jgi:DNA-binding transcriptional regulator YbjK
VTRIDQVGDAAIAVLAEQGARGLTHRAVDLAGDLPPGTTSNYARTRAALLMLTLRRIAELDAAQANEPSADVDAPLTAAGLTGLLATMLHRTLTDEAPRRRVLARLELAFEATRRPELRTAYDELGGGFRAQVAELLALAGSATPARDAWTLIAWFEGTAFYALAGAGGSAVPSLSELHAQVSTLLASMCGLHGHWQMSWPAEVDPAVPLHVPGRSQVGEPLHQAPDRDPRLQPRQRRTQAVMRPGAE